MTDSDLEASLIRAPGRSLSEETGVADYLTLDEALSRGSARVAEVSDAGSVPNLSFVNDGAGPVLLLDGEELVGAKRNRVLDLGRSAPPKAKIVRPSFRQCRHQQRSDIGFGASSRPTG